MADTFSNAKLVNSLSVYEKSPLHLEQNSTYLLPIDRNSIQGNQMTVSAKSDGGVTTSVLHINEYTLNLVLNQSSNSFSHMSMGGLNGHNYLIAQNSNNQLVFFTCSEDNSELKLNCVENQVHQMPAGHQLRTRTYIFFKSVVAWSTNDTHTTVYDCSQGLIYTQTVNYKAVDFLFLNLFGGQAIFINNNNQINIYQCGPDNINGPRLRKAWSH